MVVALVVSKKRQKDRIYLIGSLLLQVIPSAV